MKVDLIDNMGDDLRVANAARVSFDKESKWEYTSKFKGDSQGLKGSDEKLINYLAKHNHWTPFAHCTITLRETVPIFVARQRFKHTVGFVYNEVSRRYVDDRPEFYTPEEWRSRPDGNVKQGSGDKIVPEVIIKWGADKYDYQQVIDLCVEYYEQMLAAGVAPEQARMVLPQSMYTSYYTTGSLAAWARAYKLRIDPHAQAEIREVAEKWNELIRPLYPVSWDALVAS